MTKGLGGTGDPFETKAVGLELSRPAVFFGLVSGKALAAGGWKFPTGG